MEPVGVFLKEDWDSLKRMFTSNDEEDDFALQFLQCPSVEANANVAGFDETLFYSCENFNPNFYLSQGSALSTTTASNYSVCFPTQSHENNHFCDSNLNMVNDNISDQSMNFYVMDGQINALTQIFPNNNAMQDTCLKEEMGNDSLGNGNNTDLGLKRKFEVPQQPEIFEDHPKKKSLVPRDLPKDKRSIVQPKKNKKLIENVNNDEESVTYGGPNGQSSSSYCSKDDSNASQELNGGATSDSKGSAALNSIGKPRAGRGAATDPQSLYARKRREKINERLRILQSLVPNGTKVDISTMLEEAVHYVKFLQLQIKLLSSDEMWMYAPIAYNGMDMGLYQKISQTQ